MESLQLAQMLADISDLSAADQRAASTMMNANKTLTTNPQPQGQADNLKSFTPTTTPGGASPALAPNRLDKMGRTILPTPTMSRANSSTVSRQPSLPGTPRSELNDDMHQAGNFLSLYEIRALLKQQDSTGLKKAREQVDALVAKNKQQQSARQAAQSSQADGLQQGHRPRPISRTYTYPRSSSDSTANK